MSHRWALESRRSVEQPMKAIRVDAFGGVEGLRVVDCPKPVSRDGEVLVRVSASGVNFSDVMQREGLYPGGPLPPYVPGIEAAGVIESAEVQSYGQPLVGSAGRLHHSRRRAR